MTPPAATDPSLLTTHVALLPGRLSMRAPRCPTMQVWPLTGLSRMRVCARACASVLFGPLASSRGRRLCPTDLKVSFSSPAETH